MKGTLKTPGDKGNNLSEESSTSQAEAKSAVESSVESIGRVSAVQSILKAVSELTGMRYVVVARVTDERWIACAVLDEMEFGLAARRRAGGRNNTLQ